MDKYDVLKLENQLCFPLYACAREVIKRYRPYLEELNLTYTQYIAMLALWERGKCSAKYLGEKLFLDSGTLTPVLKSLENKGFILRERDIADERLLIISVTESGQNLRERAVEVPKKIAGCFQLEEGEAAELYKILHKILGEE